MREVITINNKIDSTDYVSLIPSITKACFFGYGISFIYIISKTSSILSCILGFLFSLIIVFLYLKAYNYSNDLTILQKLKTKLPKLIYYPIAIIVILTALFMNILVYYIINYFILSQYLTNTSFLIVAFILIIASVYLTLQNYETLTRLSMIITFITIILLIVNILGIMPYFDIKNILPIYNYDIKGILHGAFVFTALFTSPLLFLSFIKKTNIIDPQNINKKIFFCMITSGLILIFVIGLVLGVLGIDLATLFSYPEYIVLKKIKFNFIESIENLCFLLWVYYAFNLCSTATMFIKYSIFDMFNVKCIKKRTLITLSILLIVFLLPGYFLQSKPSFSSTIYTISPYIYFGVFICVILFLVICSIFDKNSNT